LEGRGAVRVLDMLVVSKGQDGTVMELPLGEDEDFGPLVSRLLPVLSGAGTPRRGVQELWARALSVPIGTAVIFLLVELRWARDIFTVLEQEGGAVRRR
jgi:hypothetical protein